LVDITKTLIRLQPLRHADPAIARKCNNLNNRPRAKQVRIGLILNAIEQLEGTAGDEDEDGATYTNER
jgi:hypothetical protein